jgi:hypothetical protein
MRKTITSPNFIRTILILQFIPLIMFPPSSYLATSQEWWLPLVLAVLVIVGVIELIFRSSPAVWPWLLISFAQGFNIISRLMMLMPHSFYNESGQQLFNTGYVVMTLLSIALSGLLLWYTELPEVRLGLLRK